MGKITIAILGWILAAILMAADEPRRPRDNVFSGDLFFMSAERSNDAIVVKIPMTQACWLSFFNGINTGLTVPSQAFMLKSGDKLELTYTHWKITAMSAVSAMNAELSVTQVFDGGESGAAKTNIATIRLQAEMNLTITVDGRVKKPGIVRYTPGMTVAQAIVAAGGLDTSPDGRVGVYRVTGGFADLPAPYHAVPATPKNPNSKYVVMVNILDVMKGKAPDLATQPGDLICVLELVD